jgi:SCY1-like protein 1
VATERVVPLLWPVRRQSLSTETTKWGLYTVAVGYHYLNWLTQGTHICQNTLRFIHDEALSVHGAIRVSSIFTSESGEWKLGGLEVLSSMKEDDAVIYVSKSPRGFIIWGC